jgi:hypothetical protein
MAMSKTVQQYEAVINRCKEIFLKKAQDYGTSWRVLRSISIADQIYIKAQRIRTIQENKSQRISDPVAGEFMGIINYGIIALIQDALPKDAPIDLPYSEVEKLYNQYIGATMDLMRDKNTDYGEAWRSMSQESFVDLILVKLLRIKQIIANDGQTIISEGADANFTDIINYAVFALIRQDEAAA